MMEKNENEREKVYPSKIYESPVSKRYAYITGHDARGQRTQQIVLSKEHDYAQDVKDAVRGVHEVVQSEKAVFALGQGRLGHVVLRPSMEGLRLLRALQLPFEDIEATLPQHRINPLFTLLHQSRDKHVSDAFFLTNWKSLFDSDAQALHGALTALVEDLRIGWKSAEVKRTLESARRRSDKRWKSMRDAISESFQDCSKLLAVRVDLHFHMTTDLYPLAPQVSEAQAYSCMVKFERYLRDRHPVVRYMWALEYGTQTGFHFHVLVLLNGHLVQDGVGVCKTMGEHWQNVITEGRGRYFNCNANEYRKPGLGMVHAHNPFEMGALVKNVAWYLTKTDFWMRYNAAGKTFVISQRYRQPSPGGAKRGPRKELAGVEGMGFSQEATLRFG